LEIISGNFKATSERASVNEEANSLKHIPVVNGKQRECPLIDISSDWNLGKDDAVSE